MIDNLELKNHISYLMEKRNDELEKLIKIGVIPISENNKSEEDFSKTYDVVMSLEKQIKLSENCLEISKLITIL
jgi:hypothetical protein